MQNNLQTIQDTIAYIDSHLDEGLEVEALARRAGYSKYHLSRMFMYVTGLGVHQYILRRRLTESARLLVSTEQSILDIALAVGYETQQSFAVRFKALYHCSPRAYRKKGVFCPLQLCIAPDGDLCQGEQIESVEVHSSGSIRLAGFAHSTRWGFGAISKSWRQMHAYKDQLPSRIHPEYLVGLNDYTNWALEKEKQPVFTYYAAAEVADWEGLPSQMSKIELPPGRYVVFSYRAISQASPQMVIDYVYRVWFPQSSCQFNENARYDFIRYGEAVDDAGRSRIELWVPIV